MSLPAPVTTYHTKTYPAISPTLPALSQRGKNVFITGATQGIGREMAVSFAKADVSNLAILGRNKTLLAEIQNVIKKSYPNVTAHVYAADVTDRSAVEKAFNDFAAAVQGPIHTLVANAGYSPGFVSLLDASEEQFMNTMSANVLGIRNTFLAFTPHISKEAAPGTSYRAQIIHTSTGAAHTTTPQNSTYSIAKTAAARYMEFVTQEHPDIQVISFHPGLIKSQMSAGVDEKTMGIPFDDISLPADWTVWAATPESSFLGSGRFVWAHWDVVELKEKFDKFSKGEVPDGLDFGAFSLNKNFTLGLIGWPALPGSV